MLTVVCLRTEVEKVVPWSENVVDMTDAEEEVEEGENEEVKIEV